MKKFLIALLAVLLVMACVCACGAEEPKETEPAKMNVTATDADIALLEGLYKDRVAYHGEMHDHSESGGRSDGHTELKLWASVVLPDVDADFAAIMDHKQTAHMRLPEWKKELYIGGSELATTIKDEHLKNGSMHYNIIHNDPDVIEEILSMYPEYNLRDDEENPGFKTFSYGKFYADKFREVVQTITDKGGLFVQVHPCGASYDKGDNPLDFWYGDYTGFEVLAGWYYKDLKDERNIKAYNMWVGMLNLGKKVYATAGSDSHRKSLASSLTTLYSAEKHSDAYLDRMRHGDFTAGPVGIRMAMGDVCTGGETAFTGKRLVVSAGDFHSQMPKGEYEIVVYNEKGEVFREKLDATKTQYFAIDAENCLYYRADVYSVTEEKIVAVGNPIWNTEVSVEG